MKEDLTKYIQLSFEGEEQKKKRVQESKDRYKKEKCASVQVFLEKEMVEEFKNRVKKNGHIQANLLRGFIKSYLAGSDYKYGAG